MTDTDALARARQHVKGARLDLLNGRIEWAVGGILDALTVVLAEQAPPAEPDLEARLRTAERERDEARAELAHTEAVLSPGPEHRALTAIRDKVQAVRAVLAATGKNPLLALAEIEEIITEAMKGGDPDNRRHETSDRSSAEHGLDIAQPARGDPASAPRCAMCGLPYTDPGFCDLVVPHDVWAKISPTKDEGRLLCPTCMCREAAQKGLENVTAVFCSGPFANPAREAAIRQMREALRKIERDNWRWRGGGSDEKISGPYGEIARTALAAFDAADKPKET